MEVIENRWWTPFKLPSNIELPSNTNGLLENPPFLDGWTPCLSATIHPQLGDDRWNRWISDQYVYIQLYPIYFTSHSLSRDISHCTHLDIYLFYLLYFYIYRYISHENRHFPVFIQKKVTLIFPGSQHQVTLQLLDVISELKIQRLWLQPGSESQEARCCGRWPMATESRRIGRFHPISHKE